MDNLQGSPWYVKRKRDKHEPCGVYGVSYPRSCSSVSQDTELQERLNGQGIEAPRANFSIGCFQLPVPYYSTCGNIRPI